MSCGTNSKRTRAYNLGAAVTCRVGPRSMQTSAATYFPPSPPHTLTTCFTVTCCSREKRRAGSPPCVFAMKIGVILPKARTSAFLTRLVSMDFPARCGHCQVTLDGGAIAVLGGSSGTSLFNDVWLTEDRGGLWRRVCAAAPWAARAFFGACFVHGKLVIFGGNHGPFDVWESSDRGTTWQKLPATIPSQLIAFGFCVSHEGSIFLIGGRSPVSFKPEVWRSDDAAKSWRCVHAGTPQLARWGHSAACLPDGQLVLAGGGFADNVANDVWASSDRGENWSCICAAAPWPARWDHKIMATPGGAIVLMGGSAGQRCMNDVWVSRDVGRTWSCAVGAAPWRTRDNFGASVIGEFKPG